MAEARAWLEIMRVVMAANRYDVDGDDAGQRGLAQVAIEDDDDDAQEGTQAEHAVFAQLVAELADEWAGDDAGDAGGQIDPGQLVQVDFKVVDAEGGGEGHEHEAAGGKEGGGHEGLDVTPLADGLEQMQQGIPRGLGGKVGRDGLQAREDDDAGKAR